MPRGHAVHRDLVLNLDGRARDEGRGPAAACGNKTDKIKIMPVPRLNCVPAKVSRPFGVDVFRRLTNELCAKNPGSICPKPVQLREREVLAEIANVVLNFEDEAAIVDTDFHSS